MSAADFPCSPGEITVEWLNEVLREAGVPADHAIASLEREPTAEGFGAVGSYARLRLRYERPQAGAPPSLFAKFASDKHAVPTSMSAARLYEREVRFYQHVAPLVRLRIPRCNFAAIEEEGRCLLLLEDLTSGRPADVLKGCPTSDAELRRRQIAAFHAQFWRDPRLSEWKWLPGYDTDPTARIERYRRALAFRGRVIGWVKRARTSS